jgi:hypothetical protein
MTRLEAAQEEEESHDHPRGPADATTTMDHPSSSVTAAPVDNNDVASEPSDNQLKNCLG